MKCCSKCKGENFVKVANSTVIPTLKFYLCGCGNVMMEDSDMKGILLPTPEDNGPFTRVMMEDASKAFGIPMSLGYLKEEDRPKAARKFAEMLEEYFSSLLDDEDEYDCYECDDCSHYCYCDDEEDNYAEELDEVVHFLDMIVQYADTDPEFTEVWNDLRNSGELVDLVEEILDENGLDASDLIAQKNELVKMVPAPFQEDELLARVISVFASKDIQKATDKARKEKADKLTAERDMTLEELVNAAKELSKWTEKKEPVAPQSLLEKLAVLKATEAMKNTCERTATYDDEIEEDEEETKSYVVLNKNGSWNVYENMTKEEMSNALNEDDDIEDFRIYEIKDVNMGGRVVFTLE